MKENYWILQATVANRPFEILEADGDGFDEELRHRGRSTNDEKHDREMGIAIRDKLRDEIARNGMSRTQQSLAAIMDPKEARLEELVDADLSLAEEPE